MNLRLPPSRPSRLATLRAAVAAVALGWVSAEAAAEQPAAPVVVTTSLLATAVHDLAGNAIAVETLMPAGTCPGQFDLDPGQARRIRTATLVLRHERQGFLDSRFRAAGVDAAAIAGPASPGIWTVPDTYLRYCRLLGAEIARRRPELDAAIRGRLPSLAAEMEALSAEARRQAEPLRGMRVLAAQFQAEFLAWLGLSVEGTFPPVDDPLPAMVKDSVRLARDRKVSLIVGNVQSGERMPAVLSSAAGVPCAMLSNFPDRTTAGSLAPLVRDNIRRLLEAAGKSQATGRP